MIQTVPDFTVRIGGKDFTDYLAGLFTEASPIPSLLVLGGSPIVSIEYTDQAGGEADRAPVSFARRGLMAAPKTGDEVEIQLGYRGLGLITLPTLYVDRPVTRRSKTGGRMIQIEATSIDATTDLKSPRDDSPPPDRTVRSVVGKIAARHGKTPIISDRLAGLVVHQADQTQESDLHLLSGIAKDLGADFKIVGERLLFVVRGSGQTASGAPLPLPLFLPTSGDIEEIEWISSARDKSGKVEAAWHDRDAAIRKKVTVGGGDGPVKVLRKTYPDEASARAAAEADLKNGNAGSDKVEVTMAGAPWLRSEDPFVLPPDEPEYLGDWVIQQVTHRLSKSGFRSMPTLERPR